MLNVVGESTHLRCECELLYDFIDDGVIWLKIIVEEDEESFSASLWENSEIRNILSHELEWKFKNASWQVVKMTLRNIKL